MCAWAFIDKTLTSISPGDVGHLKSSSRLSSSGGDGRRTEARGLEGAGGEKAGRQGRRGLQLVAEDMWGGARYR